MFEKNVVQHCHQQMLIGVLQREPHKFYILNTQQVPYEMNGENFLPINELKKMLRIRKFIFAQIGEKYMF